MKGFRVSKVAVALLAILMLLAGARAQPALAHATKLSRPRSVSACARKGRENRILR